MCRGRQILLSRSSVALRLPPENCIEKIESDTAEEINEMIQMFLVEPCCAPYCDGSFSY